MPENKKKLTLFEASSVVAGLGVGGGIMAVPYLASMNGIVQIVSVMILAYFLSLLLHLMVAEVVLRDEEAHQLVEIFGKYLFIKKWWGALLTWLFFALIVIIFFACLAAYIVGCAEILVKLSRTSSMDMPLWAGELITYALAAGVVFFGLKAVGISEKYAVGTLALLLAVLSIGSFGRPFNKIPVFYGGTKEVLALYGMVMFSFSCLFSIPQAVEGLAWNKKLVPRSVVIGISINFIFVLITTIMAMLVSKEITEIAILGWGEATGNWALVSGSLFFFFALLTSYWANSYALAVILQERLGLEYRTSWLIATFPTIILALIGLAGFREFLQYASGAMAILLVMLIVPALRRSRKSEIATEPIFNMGIWGGTIFQLVVIVAYIMMTVNSVA